MSSLMVAAPASSSGTWKVTTTADPAAAEPGVTVIWASAGTASSSNPAAAPPATTAPRCMARARTNARMPPPACARITWARNPADDIFERGEAILTEYHWGRIPPAPRRPLQLAGGYRARACGSGQSRPPRTTGRSSNHLFGGPPASGQTTTQGGLCRGPLGGNYREYRGVADALSGVNGWPRWQSQCWRVPGAAPGRIFMIVVDFMFY